jgi:hypothetical protein
MATYSELYGLRTNTDLRNKIAVACVVKATAYLDEATPTADEVAWANTTISNPLTMADKIMSYVLAANKSATTSQITSATDAAIQTNVDAAVTALVTGGITS